MAQCNCNRLLALTAGSSLLFFAASAPAQQAASPAAPQASAGEVGQLEEIVVTARRKEEKLENVPQTVNAISSDAIQKFNLLRFEDLSALVPGLTLNPGSAGYDAAASVRGVTFDVTTQTQPTVQFYINDAPIETVFAFTSLFDVGQIEVLRGPQGTLRGEPSPSGSITITTHRPNLEEYGGNINVTGTHLGNVDLNGAVNVPIVPDKFSIRVAGAFQNNDYDGVHSLNNPEDPSADTYAERISARLEPTDDIDANVTYQHLYYSLHSYTQVQGPGGQPQVGGEPGVLNGPPITPDERLAVGRDGNFVREKTDILTGQINWSFLGQRLSYVGSYSRIVVHSPADTDPANMLPPDVKVTLDDANFLSTAKTLTQELRLASDEPDRFWDYTVGGFYRKTANTVELDQIATYLGKTPLFIHIHSPNTQPELSAFGTLTFHLDDMTELAVGGRYLVSRSVANTVLKLRQSCANPTYPDGLCDSPLSKTPIETTFQNRTDYTSIYNVSLSHRFDENLMLYANSGSAWRPPVVQVGIFNSANDPALNSLIYLQPERSYSFEGGLKASFLDHRGRFNLAYYHQIYNGLIYKGLPAYYLATTGSISQVRNFSFTDNADAAVDGIDTDAGFQITPHWSIDGSLSFADGNLTDAVVPCNPPGPQPPPKSAFGAPPYIFTCKSNGSVSLAPPWSATIQSEYSMPIMDGVDAFVRGLYTFYASNPNGSISYTAPAYGIMNLYAGVRSPDGQWSATGFLKNAFDTQKLLSVGPSLVGQGQSSSVDTGYFGSTPGSPMVTPRLEFGVTLTYAFGSG
jgi:iron complex outermembrane receptor protein